MSTSPCDLSATAIAALVHARILSPQEVIQAHLDRIFILDPALNAFVLVRARSALQEAIALGKQRSLKSLPLAGVPIVLKDNIALAGEPTRFGSSATPATPAPADDLLVARLRAAGAIIIGKTCLPELSVWPFTNSLTYGPTHNPWDLSRTPGGSTGGGAVAVATGMAAMALGSDGGGSLRVCAACCSVLGLKPGSGLYPAPLHSWYGMTQFGPITRTVADAALALDVLSGLRTSLPALPPSSPLRIFVSSLSPTPRARLDSAVQAALDRTAAILKLAGHQIIRQDPPYPPDLPLRYTQRWLPGIAQEAASLPPSQLEPRTRKMARAGRLMTRLHFHETTNEPLTRSFLTWFHSGDLLLTPTLSSPPPALDAWPHGWFRTALSVGNWLYTVPWNLTDFPALSLPAGLTPSGLPIGLQLVAPPGGERLLLSLAAQLETLQPFPLLPSRQ